MLEVAPVRQLGTECCISDDDRQREEIILSTSSDRHTGSSSSQYTTFLSFYKALQATGWPREGSQFEFPVQSSVVPQPREREDGVDNMLVHPHFMYTNSVYLMRSEI